MSPFDAQEYHIKFGDYINKTRKRRKLKQTQLAEMVGITQPHLSYIERGMRDVDLALAIRLCDVLKVDIRDFANKYL